MMYAYYEIHECTYASIHDFMKSKVFKRKMVKRFGVCLCHKSVSEKWDVSGTSGPNKGLKLMNGCVWCCTCLTSLCDILKRIQ